MQERAGRRPDARQDLRLRPGPEQKRHSGEWQAPHQVDRPRGRQRQGLCV